MKILMIESSPHKTGSSNMLAEQFIRGAKAAGHQITVRDVGHMEINPCRGCDSCGLNKGCIQQDDMKQIEKDLLDTDMAVFVTPVYYFGMSAQLKLVIDRFYGINSKLSGRGLKTALITAAWDSNDDVMPYLRDHYQKLCRYMGFEDMGMILGTGCGTPNMTANSKHMNDAYELGKSLK